MVCGDPLRHPQGHGQLALFVFVALQLLVADGAGITSTFVRVDEREEVSPGLEVPGPEEWGESNPGSLWESRENLGAAAKSRARALSVTMSWWQRVNGGGLKGVSSPRLPRNREGLPVATVKGLVGWETRPRCVRAGLSIIFVTE